MPRVYQPRTTLRGRIVAVRRTSRDDSVPAAVVDVGWVNGLAAIRSLGRAGIRVLAVDHRPSALGFRSRYAERFLCPDPRAYETRFVAFVRALGEVVVFPTHDDSLNVLAQYLDDLPVLAPFPAWDLLEGVQASARSSSRPRSSGSTLPTRATRRPRTRRVRPRRGSALRSPASPDHPAAFSPVFRGRAS